MVGLVKSNPCRLIMMSLNCPTHSNIFRPFSLSYLCVSLIFIWCVPTFCSTLQLAKSIEFSAQAAELEVIPPSPLMHVRTRFVGHGLTYWLTRLIASQLSSKLSEVGQSLRTGGTFGAFLLLVPYLLYRLKVHWYKSKRIVAQD